MTTENRAFYYVDGIPTKGLWIDLDTVTDIDEIKDALHAAGLISADYDGDLLVADIEGDLPRCFYSSSFDGFDLLSYIECRDDCEAEDIDQDAAAAFMDWQGRPSEWNADRFRDAYQGQHDSEQAFAENLVDDCGLLDQIPESLRYYFDYEKYARDLFIDDYYMDDNGHVFNRYA